jgi:hypothetical protein
MCTLWVVSKGSAVTNLLPYLITLYHFSWESFNFAKVWWLIFLKANLKLRHLNLLRASVRHYTKSLQFSTPISKNSKRSSHRGEARTHLVCLGKYLMKWETWGLRSSSAQRWWWHVGQNKQAMVSEHIYEPCRQGRQPVTCQLAHLLPSLP